MDEAETNPPPPPPEQEARPKRRLRKQPASKSAPANSLKVAYSCKCDSSLHSSGDPESLPLHSGLPDQSSEDSTSASDSEPNDICFVVAPDSTPAGALELDEWEICCQKLADHLRDRPTLPASANDLQTSFQDVDVAMRLPLYSCPF